MRKRITSTAIVAEKVYSVREEKPQFKSFELKGRISSLDKLDRIQEREIKRMFKHLTVKSMIDEKTYLRSLRELPTTKETVTFIKEVIVPQDYQVIHDVILGDFKVGKNYLKTFIEESEIVSVINWKDDTI